MITAQDLPKRMEKFEQAHGAGNLEEAVEVLHGMVSIFLPWAPFGLSSWQKV